MGSGDQDDFTHVIYRRKMYRKNLLRKKLQAGEKLIGTWHEIPDPEVTEILSLSGLDFVLVDNEHGPGMC